MFMFSNKMLRMGVLIVCCIALFATTSFAFKVKDKPTPLDSLALSKPELWVTAQTGDAEALAALLPKPLLTEWNAFLLREGRQMRMTFDRVTGKPQLIEGEGIPWIPGIGNTLTPAQAGFAEGWAGNDLPQEFMAQKALDFLKAYPALFGIDPSLLQLNRVSTGALLDYLYYIDFQYSYWGIPVERAYLTFRVNHGNLIQVGQEFISDTITRLDPNPYFGAETAWVILDNYIGGSLSEDEIVEPGRLTILPVSSAQVLAGEAAAVGTGLDYRLAYILSFRRPGVFGTWEARVDAHNGELLSFGDANLYGHIQGGAYKTDGFPAVTIMPFPYANYSGATTYADGAGNFTGTVGTSTLEGKYVKVQSGETNAEGCNTTSITEISLAADGTGLIDFDTSTGTNCTTPGIGGVGNTHAARTQYWNVTQIKIKALTYLPTNNWLQGKMTDYVNRSVYCNAYWDGTAVNFFKSSGTCANLGELPGVSLHEWAHGMDANDGRASSDRTTGESYGDFSGTLQTHSSCAGMGAFGNTKCDGYGDGCDTCTGIRDADYMAHGSNAPWTPDMYDNLSGFTCRPYGYPNSSYPGLCRYEGHCESGVSTQALWDLAVRDLPVMGIDTVTAWQIMDRLWYASRPSQQSAFSCPSITTTDGSNTGSFYNIFRTVDDCDGNLANGTPHANAIFDAMARHKMAVGADGDATNQNQLTCCPTLATPSLSGSAASCQNNLSWNDITNAAKYKVYRNETGCSMGFTLIGTVTDPTLTFADTNVSEGTTYYYRVQAVGTSDACVSAMSSCVTINAAACGGSCTAPGAPNLTAATGDCSGVNLTWTAGTGTTGSYNVYRFTGACGGAYAKIAGPVLGTTYSDTTAVAGTSYAYVVRGACNADGTTESVNSNCRTASALATPAIPAAPTLTDDCTGIIVSWSAITGAATYDVMRRTGGCGNNGWAAVQSGITGTTWTDTTAAAGTTYGYYIAATNACGTAGDKVNCTALAHTAAGAPAAPTGLTATGVCASVNLSWTASTGATSYNILRTTNANCSTGLAQIGTSATTTYSDTTAVAGTTYYYVVQAVSTCGTSGNSSCANAARLQTPAAPTGLTATGSCTAVDLSWTATSGAASYEVWRTTNANCTTGSASIATPTGAAYSDTSAVAGTTYYYSVKAVNACGTSAISNCANAARTSAPAAPTGLSATGNCSAVALSWTASSGATSYEVWRSTNSNCTTGAASIGTSAITTYSDTTAVAGTTYYYSIKAVNTCGTSGISNCANAVRLATPAAPASPTYTAVSCATLTVNWTAVSGATAYDIYRRTGACGTGSVIAADLAGTTYNDTGLSASTQYSYYLVAKNTCGSSASGACTSTTTTGAPTAPAGLTATGVCAGVDLGWTAAAGATSYEIWRTTNSNCTTGAVLIGSPAGTAYSDGTAVAGTPYYYTVKAVNACGTSAVSNCANAARLSIPGVPSITGITDNSACAQDGIRVAYTNGSGATSHDLYRDGASVVTGYASNALYNSGDSVSHSYTVRAVNACGGTTSGAQNFTDTDNSTIPTISGANANTCPFVTVNLSTQAGMTGYQWYRNAGAIGGATTDAHTATLSGTYTVRYTNGSGCTATSAGHAVTINPCEPNIIYQSNLPPTELAGDGDGVMEAGEKWQIQVTVFNNGQADAAAVLGSLAGEGLATCNNPGAFGDIPVGGTGTFTFIFIPDPAAWYGTYACLSSIGFDLVGKSSNTGTYAYADDTDFAARQVGSTGAGTPETAVTANFTAPANTTSTRSLSPDITTAAGSVSTASAAYTANTWSSRVDGALLRHQGSGATVALGLPTGDGTPVVTNVTAFCQANGAGTYQMEWLIGGKTVALAAIGLTVTPAAAPNCDTGTATCANVAPEVSDDGLHRLSVSKNADPAFVDLMFEDVAAAAYSIYVSNQVNTHPFQVNDNLVGVHTCTLPSSPAVGGMRLASGVVLESGFHPAADTTVLYYLVTANNGAGTEGSLGSDSVPTARTADSYCAK